MADNPFAKKFDKNKKSDNDGDEGTMHGKMPGHPPGKGEKSGGNPFAKKMEGKRPPPKKRGRKRPARKGKLQKFGQRY